MTLFVRLVLPASYLISCDWCASSSHYTFIEICHSATGQLRSENILSCQLTRIHQIPSCSRWCKHLQGEVQRKPVCSPQCWVLKLTGALYCRIHWLPNGKVLRLPWARVAYTVGSTQGNSPHNVCTPLGGKFKITVSVFLTYSGEPELPSGLLYEERLLTVTYSQVLSPQDVRRTKEKEDSLSSHPDFASAMIPYYKSRRSLRSTPTENCTSRIQVLKKRSLRQ